LRKRMYLKNNSVKDKEELLDNFFEDSDQSESSILKQYESSVSYKTESLSPNQVESLSNQIESSLSNQIESSLDQTELSLSNQNELPSQNQTSNQIESSPKYIKPLSSQVGPLQPTSLNDNNLPDIQSHHQLSRKYANESLANYRDRMKNQMLNKNKHQLEYAINDYVCIAISKIDLHNFPKNGNDIGMGCITSKLSEKADSIKSRNSQMEFQYIDGRRYPNAQSIVYPLPNEEESDRLHLQLTTFFGKIYLE
ncbi:13893_t:CDS:2, partial [Dentiscutata heterogama]